jgi:hypothetical protein
MWSGTNVHPFCSQKKSASEREVSIYIVHLQEDEKTTTDKQQAHEAKNNNDLKQKSYRV